MFIINSICFDNKFENLHSLLLASRSRLRVIEEELDEGVHSFVHCVTVVDTPRLVDCLVRVVGETTFHILADGEMGSVRVGAHHLHIPGVVLAADHVEREWGGCRNGPSTEVGHNTMCLGLDERCVGFNRILCASHQPVVFENGLNDIAQERIHVCVRLSLDLA